MSITVLSCQTTALYCRQTVHPIAGASARTTWRACRKPVQPFGYTVASIFRSSFMTPTITAFAQSPDRGQGLARDMRVRWALEEVGQPYEVRLVTFGQMKEPAHLALNPFGQIPTYEEGNLALF